MLAALTLEEPEGAQWENLPIELKEKVAKQLVSEYTEESAYWKLSVLCQVDKFFLQASAPRLRHIKMYQTVKKLVQMAPDDSNKFVMGVTDLLIDHVRNKHGIMDIPTEPYASLQWHVHEMLTSRFDARTCLSCLNQSFGWGDAPSRASSVPARIRDAHLSRDHESRVITYLSNIFSYMDRLNQYKKVPDQVPPIKELLTRRCNPYRVRLDRVRLEL